MKVKDLNNRKLEEINITIKNLRSLTTFPSQDILRTSFTNSCEWCSFRNSIHTSPVSRMLT